MKPGVAKQEPNVNNRPLRALLDVNVYISAYLYGGALRLILRAATQHQYELVSSGYIRDELLATLQYTKFREQLLKVNLTPDQIVANVTTISKDVRATALPADVVRDKKDVEILGVAVGGNADYLVAAIKT